MAAQTSTLAFPSVRIGEPATSGSLRIFPLFSDAAPKASYLLSDEAIKTSKFHVRETSEGGSVPELLVENETDNMVLLLEGEELVGAKQNRVLNTTVLVPRRSKTKVPVSCVELGRWSYNSPDFESSQRLSSSTLRYVLRSTVSHSVTTTGTHTSSQGAVWDEIDRQQRALGVTSRTKAMSDTHVTHIDDLNATKRSTPYAAGASGLAIAFGPDIVSVDLFDKPQTCERMWNPIVAAAALAGLERRSGSADPTRTADLEATLSRTFSASWTQVPSVGEGTEFRSAVDDAAATATCHDGSVLHVSVIFPRRNRPDDPARPTRTPGEETAREPYRPARSSGGGSGSSAYSSTSTRTPVQSDEAWAIAWEGSLARLTSKLAEHPEWIEAGRFNGKSLIHYAAAGGNAAAISHLVDLGQSPDERDADGWTPMHFAVFWDRPAAVIRLLELGATRDARTNDGKTPREVAEKG